MARCQARKKFKTEAYFLYRGFELFEATTQIAVFQHPASRPLKKSKHAGCSKMVRCQARKKFKIEAYFLYARV
jgi:hypothetical protein